MNPLAPRRVAAYALDCAGYLGIAAALVPVGLLIVRAGLGGTPAYTHAVSVVPIVIGTLVAARSESRGATWGKRRLGLTVVCVEGGTVTFSRALLRNAVKVAVPWQLGHVVAIGAVYGGFDPPDPALVAAGAAVYAGLGAGLWGLLRANGRGVHDLAARTRVERAVGRVPAGMDLVKNPVG